MVTHADLASLRVSAVEVHQILGQLVVPIDGETYRPDWIRWNLNRAYVLIEAQLAMLTNQ